MNEVSKGTISLNDPIQDYLSFNIKKDSFQNEKLRIEHLVTHSSGLKRGPFMSFKRYANYLKRFELDYLPGITWEYNTLALALAGHIVIQKNQSSWTNLLNQKLLKPLRMTNTYANSAEAPKSNRMQCVNKKGKTIDCLFEVNDAFIWPSGAIVSNVDDMLIWLHANIDKESLDSDLHFIHATHDLLEETISIPLFKDVNATQEIVWWHLQMNENDHILYHGGTTPDHTTFIAFDKTKGNGVIVYTNIDWPIIRNENKTLKTSNLCLEILEPSR